MIATSANRELHLVQYKPDDEDCRQRERTNKGCPSPPSRGPKRESRVVRRGSKGKEDGGRRYFTGFACRRTLIIFVPSGIAGLILSRSARTRRRQSGGIWWVEDGGWREEKRGRVRWHDGGGRRRGGGGGGDGGEERRGRAEGSRVEATEGVGRGGRRMRRVIKWVFNFHQCRWLACSAGRGLEAHGFAPVAHAPGSRGLSASITR